VASRPSRLRTSRFPSRRISRGLRSRIDERRDRPKTAVKFGRPEQQLRPSTG
jgi:hypothetical protein